MLNRLRTFLSSSPRIKETTSPSGSLPLPPRPVPIRRALYQPDSTAVPTSTSLTVEDVSTSDLNLPSIIANIRPLVPATPAENILLSHFLSTPPDTIVQFASQNLGIILPDITTNPATVNPRSENSSLNTHPDTIVNFTSHTPARDIGNNRLPVPATGSSLATPSVIINFDDQGREIPPWTPYIHPSSSNFFAADSPVFVAPMSAKRSSPADGDDLESTRTTKRVKTHSEHDQSASPVASLHQSSPSKCAPKTAAIVYTSNNTRAPARPARKRKRAKEDDDEEDDVDYSASSRTDSDSDTSRRIGNAKTGPPGIQTTINKPQSPPTAPPSTSFNRRAKRTQRARSDSLYVDEGASDEVDFEVPEAHERNELGFNLTRERAQRLANAVQVPEDSNMCAEERDLYSELALRGIKPVMSYDWARDFSTLPESLFIERNPSKDEEDKLTLKADKGTEFAAKRAFQELLKIGGCVRDCKILTVQPETVIERAIRKYIRWAITDAGLKTGPEIIPVHTIYIQRPGESTLSAVAGLGKRLERMAQRHQRAHGNAYWPSLIGFLICGPILSIMTLDTNPQSEVWAKEGGDGEDPESRAKYLGLFDMSEGDSDVWNSLAVALAVIQMRQSMCRLANAYDGPLFPRLRGQNHDSDDEDL